MPLVRFELKNEYGLGDPRLYQGAPKEEEDPRSILGGVTVSGLVGILRQLGDLAELAAVVFHDVHQLVMTTAARGHKVLNRIQKIEATLPRFEKAVHEQNSHIHFAYIAGCGWHSKIQTGQSHIFLNDLPEFMSDSYEECRGPPRLHLLDKFDSAGAGACLKRYSDPSYFRMFMSSSDSVLAEKANIGMKVQRKKKPRSKGRNGLAHHSINVTLHGRSNMQFASLATDELSFSVDDASASDTLSISGFTTEHTHFSSNKRSGCLEVQSTPASMSKELFDIPATQVEATQKVDSIFNDDNKVTTSDYVIQNSLHQKKNPSSSSIDCDEKPEMVRSVTQMLSHDLPEDGLNPKAAGHSSLLSNGNHLIDGRGIQGEQISRSLTWDESSNDSLGACVKTVSILPYFVSNENATGDLEIPDKIVYSTCSAALDEEAEIIDSASSKIPDGFIPSRHLDSDLLFVTLEMSNRQSEMNYTEMHNQENVLPDTVKAAVPFTAGGQIGVLTSQLDKCMDASNALDSKDQTNFEYCGQEMILSPHLNYNGMECEINKILAVTIPSLDDIDSEIVHEPRSSLKKNFSQVIPLTEAVVIDRIPPEGSLTRDSFDDNYAKTVSENEILCEHRTKQEMESKADSNSSGKKFELSSEKVIAASKLDCPDYESLIASCSSSPCPGFIIPSTQAVVIDGVPPPESLSQVYFSGTSAKTSSEKQIFCECQTKQETESTDDSKCQGNEYQSNIEKVIAAAKLDDSDSNTKAMVSDGIPPEESLSQDSFVDISAKIATENEVLCEHQTKQGTESMSKSNCQGTEYQIITEKVITASKFDGPSSETHVASRGASDAYASPILCDSSISSSVESNSSSTLSSDVTLSGSLMNIISPRNDFEDPRGNMSAQLTNKSVILPSDVTAATTVVSQVFPVESLRKSSINIWTNGGLLGLEPSKPPDISVPNACGNDDIYDDRLAANSQARVLGSGNESRKLFFEEDKLNRISFPEQDNAMGKISDNQSESMFSKKCPKSSIQASFCEIGKAQNAYLSGATSEIDSVQGKEGSSVSSEASIYYKNRPESTVSRRNNIAMSVGFSSLARRFLVSSLQRKSSMTGIAPLSELMKNDIHKLLGTKIHSKDKEGPKQTISSAPLRKLGDKEDLAHEFSEKLVSSSLDSSGYQSPPLEHMKVSFNPMIDSDVSKLNLEFFSSQQQGNIMFPSFQLLPASFQPLLDGVLESDDDTFCRSCPYSSDDLLTLHSESDDEIWGEDEIDISYRIEATDSISSSIELNDCNACTVSQVSDDENLERGSDELSFNSGDIIDLPNI
ncbi:SCAR-like protein 2 [Dendrobium catenatum]|uniref:Protein SCAR n=1 Tax=Dendrobium catenatum TaxID=906689 RepID=A0A2I0WTM7_9ASPA|nr:SCAR-like protein 2 [Dendrobium catenatum]